MSILEVQTATGTGVGLGVGVGVGVGAAEGESEGKAAEGESEAADGDADATGADVLGSSVDETSDDGATLPEQPATATIANSTSANAVRRISISRFSNRADPPPASDSMAHLPRWRSWQGVQGLRPKGDT